jgi:hypothetical protein
MRGCPNHPTVFTMHPSGICAICRAAADAGPTAIAPPYSIPAAAQEPPAVPTDGMVECQFCDNKIAPWDLVCKPCWAAGHRSHVYEPLPDSARRILDMGRTQQAAQQPVDERAAGVARAVANLSNHEHRLGAARFQP